MQSYPYEQGFLSDAIAEVRPVVRERYAAWRALLLIVNARCISAQHAAEVDTNDPRALLAAAHFARLLASVQAAAILLEHGLLAQARSLLRVALESLFALAAVHAKPEIATVLAKSQEAATRVVADRMLQWQAPELKASVESQITEDELKTYLAIKTPEVKTFELAQAANMVDWYLTLYSLLSFPAHATVSDVMAHLVTGAAGDIVGLKNEPELDGQHSAWAYALEIEMRAADAFAGVFGLTGFSMDGERARLRALAAEVDN